MNSPPQILNVIPSPSKNDGRAAHPSSRWKQPSRRIAACLLTVVYWQPTCFAIDRVFLEVGAGQKGDLIRLGAQRELGERSFSSGKWHLGALLELDFGSWYPELGDDGLYEIGVTPVFRLGPNRPSSSRLMPFLEAAVGAHLLSNVRFSDLNLSTSLQFGSHIGAGLYFGKNQTISLVYRYQHLSNASIKQPNPGIEFHLLQVGYRFNPSR